MCGLLVFIGARDDAYTQRAALTEALELLRHRGAGAYVQPVGGNILLGHRRPGPPAATDDGRLILVYDGSLANQPELRTDLGLDPGDDEAGTILAGYLAWGEGLLDRLRGPFALVLIDTRQKLVFGARDPFGIRPLYSLVTAEGLFLASEKKALRPWAAGAAIDVTALSHYFTMEYVPEPATLHRGVHRVGSGECFTYRAGGVFATRRYHQPRFAPAPPDLAEALYRRILAALTDSVYRSLPAGRPVGVVLTGGISSAALVALARSERADLRTVLCGYEGPGELAEARGMAQRLAVAPVEVVITPDDVVAALPRIVEHLDDPVAHPAAVAQYLAAGALPGGVLLSAAGADEVFGGYARYREPLSLAAVTGLPDPVQRGLRRVAQVLPAGVKGRGFLERGTTPIELRYHGHAQMFTDEGKHRLLPGFDGGAGPTDVTGPAYREAAAAGLDDVTKMQYIDLYTWLRGDILVRADRLAWAHGVEPRLPYLDLAVFGVAATVPVELKLPPHSTETKYALRQAVRELVPPPMGKRRKPVDVPLPLRAWLRGELADWAGGILADSTAGDLLDLGYARELLAEHVRGEADHFRRLWTVLVFCLWYERFGHSTH